MPQTTPQQHPPTATDQRIFVQIPCYRDPEIAPTLLDLFAKASRPDNLNVTLVWQRDSNDTLPDEVLHRENLNIIHVPYQESGGCNWARRLAQQQWADEPYTLLLDSHHRFVQNWDEKLIDLLEQQRQSGSRKPVITGYLPPYVPGWPHSAQDAQPLKLYPFRRVEGMLLRLISYPIIGWRELSHPIGANFVSLHFLFADGTFNRDVEFDPECYFVGDEVSTSVRAYTAGYDLYHPQIVLGWHCYDRVFRRPHWQDHASWSDQERHSIDRMRQLFSGKVEYPFGLGRQRELVDYENELMLALVEAQ